tara:strand:- start:242 stop:1129 length:888 start_codon:yes stop_codon:yes gene_type:complete
MNIEKVAINIGAIEKLKEETRSEYLKEIISLYEKRVHQIFGTIFSPIAIMNYGMKEAREAKLYLDAISKTNNFGKQNTPKGKKEIETYIRDFQDKNNRELVNESIKKLKEFQIEYPNITDFLDNNNLNSLVNFWTSFETTLKDVWKVSLNKNPEKYFHNITKRVDFSDLPGFSNKTINLGVLAQYNFDISKSLGDLLSPKFDFTSIKGIKISYQSLFTTKNNDLSFMDSETLNQLEISRHLIVHRAGIIDNDYLRRTKKIGEVLGENIKFSTEEYFNMYNESISATAKLIKALDD